MAKLIVFTDGSSCVFKDKNGKKFGGIGVYINGYEEHNISESINDPNITNQRAEIFACIAGINKCKQIMKEKGEKFTITIFTDSMYTINSSTVWAKQWEKNGWQRKVGKKFEQVANLDIIKPLYELSKINNVSFIHVRSHQKEPQKTDQIKWLIWSGNKIADELANSAMKKIRSIN
jgi:ribonuclease HI